MALTGERVLEAEITIAPVEKEWGVWRSYMGQRVESEWLSGLLSCPAIVGNFQFAIIHTTSTARCGTLGWNSREA